MALLKSRGPGVYKAKCWPFYHVPPLYWYFVLQGDVENSQILSIGQKFVFTIFLVLASNALLTQKFKKCLLIP